MTSPQNPRKPDPVAYKGELLDAERGPGLGCFRIQMIVLLGLIILTPVTAVAWAWPVWATSVLLILMLLLLLLTGQTMIFLLRLVAAGRSEGRRRPLASSTPTVGEIEDETPAEAPAETARADAQPAAESATPAPPADAPGSAGNDASGMRQ